MSTNVDITFYPTAAPFSSGLRQPLAAVREYSTVEVQLAADQPRDGLDLYVGGELLAAALSLRGSASYRFEVEDYCGLLRWELRDPSARGGSLAAAELTVLPSKLTAAEVAAIKEQRIPQLLARLQARNAIRLRYDADGDRLYHFYSLPYSVERLLAFSRDLLGGSPAIYERLAYRSESERFVSLPLRGHVSWAATARRWANQPASTGLLHDCQREVKSYDVQANRIFVAFHRQLAAEMRAMAGAVGGKYSAIAADLRARAVSHEGWTQRQLLAAVGPLTTASSGEGVTGGSPAYSRLLKLWRDFATRYVTLDPTAHLSGLQPMHKLYELWCVCEVAAALGLHEDDAELRRGASFSGSFGGQSVLLRYDQPVAGGWFTSQLARNRAPRPDLLLQVGQQRLLLDVKYRIDNEQARTDDMMKMLAYMNDLNVAVGGIIYPGDGPLVAYPAAQAGKVVYALPLRPGGDFATMQAQLRTQLQEVIGLCQQQTASAASNLPTSTGWRRTPASMPSRAARATPMLPPPSTPSSTPASPTIG